MFNLCDKVRCIKTNLEGEIMSVCTDAQGKREYVIEYYDYKYKKCTSRYFKEEELALVEKSKRRCTNGYE